MSTTTKITTANGEQYDGFTDEERGAMKARAKELKTGGRRGVKADTESECSRRSPRCRSPTA